jgi:hypothetical protein
MSPGTTTGKNGLNGSMAAEAAAKPADQKGRDLPFPELIIDQPDGRGRKVLDILWRVTDFAIYKTELGVNACFSDDTAKKATQMTNYLAIQQELARMNYLIHLSGHRAATVTYYEREMASGIAQSLMGNPSEAKAILAAASDRLEKKLQNRGRVKYFLSCLFATLAISSAVYITGFHLTPSDDGTVDGWVKEIVVAMVVGSLGALLSTSIGLRDLRVDVFVDWRMHFLYGALRVLVGVLGALTLFLAVKSGIALGAIVTDGGTPSGVGDNPAEPLDLYKLAFISVLAGFSERLVPSLLDRNGATPPDQSPPAPPSPPPSGVAAAGSEKEPIAG